ncbi:AGC protein kinase [Puccinia triticina 1-1 BBBD Race 1]|uniref:AGC protein kinase n=1 Tax=Puccinia triticina (isolate 1-1 / race 1 (BBBD)) TaxID=630390 RepID=A0A180G3T9_PUCT1|nr:AGC protein kinase [Puccinia triticina 1-1 BBBD Race 1]
MRVLGKGCAGKVLMVRYRRPAAASSQVYAMKSIKKNHVLSHRELQHTLTEQSVLRRVADEPESNPFIVRLWWSFHVSRLPPPPPHLPETERMGTEQDKDHLFLVMDFHPGGDLATQLARWGRLGRDRARFYAAEITEGVASLHRSGVIYRDLKPENILIAFDGHIVLTDFGLSKQFQRAVQDQAGGEDEDERTLTFCGTAEYLAPEVLLGEPYSYEVDWWSFGTMLYEMLTGLTPFWSEDHATMYRRVLHEELVFSEDSNRVMDHDTKTLLRGLLQRNPAVRMTGERIKKHPYFGMIDWDHVQHKRYIPPYVPAVNPNDATDTQNFDETFLAMEPTYVQDDDPPGPARPSESKDKAEQDEEGEEGEGKVVPQRAVDENGLDVFDGYSYLAPSHARDSVILEDEEDEASADAGDAAGSADGGQTPSEPVSPQPGSPLPAPAAQPTTVLVVPGPPPTPTPTQLRRTRTTGTSLRRPSTGSRTSTAGSSPPTPSSRQSLPSPSFPPRC